MSEKAGYEIGNCFTTKILEYTGMVCVGSPAQPVVSNVPTCRFKPAPCGQRPHLEVGIGMGSMAITAEPAGIHPARRVPGPSLSTDIPGRGCFLPSSLLSQEPGTPSQGGSGICSSQPLDPHNHLQQCEKQQQQLQPAAPGEHELLPHGTSNAEAGPASGAHATQRMMREAEESRGAPDTSHFTSDLLSQSGGS